MTIIAAVQDPDDKDLFYIAGNSMATDGGHPCYDSGKWRVFDGRLAVALSGSFRGANVLNEWARVLASRKKFPSLFDIVKSLRKAFEDDGWSSASDDKDDQEPETDYKQMILLVGRFDGEPCVVDIDRSFGFMVYPQGHAAFDGGGAYIARAVWNALMQDGAPHYVDTAEGLRRATLAAIQDVLSCPGELEFQEFRLT